MPTHFKLQAAPLTFTPILKSVVWGGSRLGTYKNLDSAPDRLGESWEISTVPDMETIVDSGIYRGRTLSSLIEEHGAELLGTSVVERYGRVFPLLIKFLDAAKDLSVQVHPDDEMAMRRHGCMGKSEMWYIVDATPDSIIRSGFNSPLEPETYLKRLENGTLSDALAAFTSRAGQVYFLPPRRVHSIGGGNLVAEISGNSDITYRIYDYGRVDADGNPRPLHTDLALGSIDFNHEIDPPVETGSSSTPEQLLVDCHQFVTHLLQVDKSPRRLDHDSRSFTIIICVSGSVSINYPGGDLTLSQGHTALLPASLGEVAIQGEGRVLATRCRR